MNPCETVQKERIGAEHHKKELLERIEVQSELLGHMLLQHWGRRLVQNRLRYHHDHDDRDRDGHGGVLHQLE